MTISDFTDSYIYMLKKSMKEWNIDKESGSGVFGTVFEYCLIHGMK